MREEKEDRREFLFVAVEGDGSPGPVENLSMRG
jgi:hypothetical protein